MNVAFLSTAFTKNLYKGLVEVTPLKCSGLPEDDDGVESLISGGGVDACVLVAAVEGQWKEDIELLKQEYHEGIMDLTGAAHVGRSSTAWARVNEGKSKAEKKKTGKALPYHIPKKWGTDASAVWPEQDPFYIYVQDPANVQLLFTLFDDDVVGEGSAIGSTYTPLAKVLPQVKFSQEQIVSKLKKEIIDKIKRGEIDPDKVDEEVAKAVKNDIQAWEGDLKLTSKPRIKNKNNQVAMGMAAGAMVAGPVGAAMGAALGNMYEGQIKGRINLRLRYLPIAQLGTSRNRYTVMGGMPGINWGDLYSKYLAQRTGFDSSDNLANVNIAGNDLEHCFFISHDVTGGCCAVYRSLEEKLIVVSFRGTCGLVDLVTDASIVQEPWVEGEDPKDPDVAMVHVGFRNSMASISRRLKELVLVTVPPGDSLSDYDMLITGHSLGGALANLFIADIGEYGIDAGRALPQTEPSDAWWKAIASTFTGKDAKGQASREPPRPKSLSLYNFGSPRVGNKAFTTRFDKIMKEGKIDQAYRMVNDKDVVARMPRTMSAVSVNYDHCGSTVLVQVPTQENAEQVLWIEGESDDGDCPVRDREQMMSSPTAEGSLLGDLLALAQEDGSKEGSKKTEKESTQLFGQLGNVASKFQKRLSSVTAADITSVLGIDKSFTEREITMVQSLLKGDALAHHMEDSYYAAMGRASGFVAVVGEDVAPVGVDSVKLLASEPEKEDSTGSA
jgi:hypothetical protein